MTISGRRCELIRSTVARLYGAWERYAPCQPHPRLHAVQQLALVDPACEQAEGGELFGGLLLAKVAEYVGGGVADGQLDAWCEQP